MSLWSRAAVLVPLLAGCGSTWKVVDGDGDGISPAEGDCWDLTEGPKGSGLTGADIFPGAPDAWYDGFDTDCAGNDDFDADGDGWVPLEEYVGKPTLGVPDSGEHLGAGDCWDAPVDSAPIEGFAVVPVDADTLFDGIAYTQPTPDLVHPGVGAADSALVDAWYDGVDQDCAGNDDFDADSDGFSTAWHPTVAGAYGTDCIDGSARDADNPAGTAADEVNPAATEAWYDGTDQDCDLVATVDCDQDGDGFRADPTVGDPADSACIFEGDEQLDCLDTDDTVVPLEGVIEVPYNGEDDNCDYRDTDGDADGDGAWALDYEDRLAEGGYTLGATVIVPDQALDCWDDPEIGAADAEARTGFPLQAINGFDALTAFEVGPAMEDRPYDAADQDCAGEDADANGAIDDFDWDADGVEVEVYPTLGGSTGGDCLDCPLSCTDGTASAEAALWCASVCEGVQDSNPGGVDPALIYAGAAYDAPYDGTDQDCDDWSDFDADRDGYDHELHGGADCYEDQGIDLDGNPAGLAAQLINPGRAETWYDGTDQDCNDLSDDDADEDGQDAEFTGGTDCIDGGGRDTDANPAGLAAAAVFTGATETWYDGTDQDCNNRSDNDADRDGYDWEGRGGTDCIDGGGSDVDANPAALAAAAVNPAASDTWYDGTDANCDNNDGDADGDGYYISSYAFSVPAGFTAGDCDDVDSGDYPGATETTGNEDDENCDGGEVCFVDADNDNYRLSTTVASADVDCTDSGEARSSEATGDCDDADAGDYPGALETTGNSDDENCDGQEVCFDDDDNDGFLDTSGDTRTSTDTDCADANEGTTSDPTTDCDDADSGDFPGATETVANGDDENCDGRETCFVNADGDGYRLTTTVVSTDPDCSDSGEALSSLASGDCDDADSGDYPGALETTGNQDDENCDGQEVCFDDDDNDGFLDTSGDTRTSTDTDCLDTNEGTNTDPTTDCDDADSADYPGATETVANGDDEDCNGGEICFVNADNDSHRLTTTVVSTDPDCSDSGEALSSLSSGDCDDTDSGDYPSAPETTGNEDDESCDGTEVCFVDADNDGYRLTTTVASTDLDCADSGEARSSEPAGDCDDAEAGDNPGATEITGNSDDENCDGQEVCFDDDDNDGFLDSSGDTRTSTDTDCADANEGTTSDLTTDCDDADSGDYPSAPETTGNEDDENCDGGEVCFVDADNDGYRLATTITSADTDCADSGEARFSEPTGDCDDTDAGDNPGATETTGNGDDENCNGTEICFDDDDNDGFLDTSGDTRASTDTDCADANEGTNTDPTTDCDDTDSGDYPSAPETTGNSDDEDCDGTEICFDDDDNDGFLDSSGDTRTSTTDLDCADAFEGTSADATTDCDDTDAARLPTAVEVAGDSVDQNCDGQELCFADADNDGYRLSTTVTSTDTDCNDSGEAITADPTGDCNDAVAAINPGAAEACDAGSVDEDCDGNADDADTGGATGKTNWYTDADGDNYGATASAAVLACDRPTGRAGNNTDCNDAAATINPGATEVVGDEVDQTCDGQELCYVDADGDFWGTTATVVSVNVSCEDTGESILPDDCDDTDATISPDGTETRNGEDDDCDEYYDEGLLNPGDLAFTEVHYNPSATTENNFEWIEIANTTGVDIVLGLGWTFFDCTSGCTTSPVFASSSPTTPILIPTGEYRVVGRNSTPAQNGSVTGMVWTWPVTFILSNSADVFRADFADPVEGTYTMDQISWTSSSPSWPGQNGRSMQLSTALGPTTHTDNDVRTNWCTSSNTWGTGTDQGTPNLAEDCP